ncbi:hypothetical protein [Bacteroides intestinalis]|jgi:hypothetical protein|uniref:hypothetical protein n=1 Tax=Bacteroides intestinalis TaxID=329854 RepID=UPI00216AC70F|nr:hypothetical protein [Bacteroides intestinalis]
MSKYVRLFFNRKKKATTTVAGAIEIVVCLQRERCYFHSGHNVTLDVYPNIFTDEDIAERKIH